MSVSRPEEENLSGDSGIKQRISTVSTAASESQGESFFGDRRRRSTCSTQAWETDLQTSQASACPSPRPSSSGLHSRSTSTERDLQAFLEKDRLLVEAHTSFTDRAADVAQDSDVMRELQAFLEEERFVVESHPSFANSVTQTTMDLAPQTPPTPDFWPTYSPAIPGVLTEQTLPVGSEQSWLLGVEVSGDRALQHCEQEEVSPPFPVYASTRRKLGKGRNGSLVKAGSYIGVRCDQCTLDICRVISPKTGAEYQKCNCYVKDVQGDKILIKYAKNEHVDEWIGSDDPRVFLHKDEKWCQHGRICNRMLRNKKCAKHDTVGSCWFCHEPACHQQYVQ